MTLYTMDKSDSIKLYLYFTFQQVPLDLTKIIISEIWWGKKEQTEKQKDIKLSVDLQCSYLMILFVII